jgi:hypothetical protein
MVVGVLEDSEMDEFEQPKFKGEALLVSRSENIARALEVAFKSFLLSGGDPVGSIELIVVVTDGLGSSGSGSAGEIALHRYLVGAK